MTNKTIYEQIVTALGEYEPMINAAKLMRLEINLGPVRPSSRSYPKQTEKPAIEFHVMVRDYQL